MALVTAGTEAIGYSGNGAPDPRISAAPTASLGIGRALPGAFWITQCGARGSTMEGMQTAFRTVDAEAHIESSLVGSTDGGCP
jgi:hypothetical protein